MIDFLLKAYALKDTVRTGWTLRGVENPESVGDHAWGTALLCLVAGPGAGVDVARSVAMAVVHDLAECITGDIPSHAAQTITPDEKARLEARAMEALMALLPSTAAVDVQALWAEYEARRTPEALFVRDMNLLDMLVQALAYETAGRNQSTLDEFFVTTEKRLSTDTGRAMYAAIVQKRG